MTLHARPWGSYEILCSADGYQVKRIRLKPGLRFSLQKHRRRAEKWIVISGQGIATIGQRESRVKRGSFIEVPVGRIHRMKNTGKIPMEFIEVQFGKYLGEDDIIRLADDFARA